MSKTSTFVKMQSDGTMVRIKPDGTEEKIAVSPVTPRSDEAVTEAAESIQVASVRFNKVKSPLLLSVRYRQEDIGSGANGFFVTDNAGVSHDLINSDSVKVEVVKPGPFYVVLSTLSPRDVDGGEARDG